MLGSDIVTLALEDWRSSALDPRLRAALCFLEKLTLCPNDVNSSDVEPLRAAGVGSTAMEEVVHICALFCLIDRVADALGFEVPSPECFARGAELLLKHGYGSKRQAGCQ